jgi:DNA-binding LacI/PurR family transcriptional regulator
MFGGAEPAEALAVPSKYRSTTRQQIEEHVSLCGTIDEALAGFRKGDLWVFERDRHASHALQWASDHRVPVPRDISIMGLENDPAFFDRGITTCIMDWETIGYLLAHVLIGDFAVERTSRGFVRTASLLLEKLTTPR